MLGEARVVRPDRSQIRWDMLDLEALLAEDHRVRIVWSFVESLDLSELYAAIRSREGEVGRPATDPMVLLALWLYATVEGVGSARQLDRLLSESVTALVAEGLVCRWPRSPSTAPRCAPAPARARSRPMRRWRSGSRR